MNLPVHHFAIQNLEGIQMDAFKEREDSITNGGIVGQAEIFLRGTRGRDGMTMPVGKNLQAILTCVFQRSELILRGERKMLWGVVDILHPVVLRYHVTVWTANAQQVTTRLIRCVLLGLVN